MRQGFFWSAPRSLGSRCRELLYAGPGRRGGSCSAWARLRRAQKVTVFAEASNPNKPGMLPGQQGMARHWKTVSGQPLCGPLATQNARQTELPVSELPCPVPTAVSLMCSLAWAWETREHFPWAGQLARCSGPIPCLPLDIAIWGPPGQLQTPGRSALVTAIHPAPVIQEGSLIHESLVH